MINDSPMSGEMRRNIFLSIKEALNNILKHSKATSVQIDMLMRNNRLIIRIQDNGTGIDEERLRRFGNGLANMRKRMESVNGKFKIENEGGGTRVSFTIPLETTEAEV
jgi:signal transduction histidine kinase